MRQLSRRDSQSGITAPAYGTAKSKRSRAKRSGKSSIGSTFSRGPSIFQTEGTFVEVFSAKTSFNKEIVF